MTTPPQQYRLVATVGGEGTKAAAAAGDGGAENGAGGATVDGGDGENQILTVLGGKASCRRKFVIHVHLVDGQGNAVVKEEYEQLSIVATVAYAHDKSPIAPAAPPASTEPDAYGGGGGSNGSGNQQQILAEPPLLTTFNGVEYPSHHRPSRLVSGKASFKLAISLLSSKYDNRLFCICFSPLYPNANSSSSVPPLFPCFSKPIRSISRKRSSSVNAAAAASILHLSHPGSDSAAAASNFLPNNNLTSILNPNPTRKPHHRRPSRSSTAAPASVSSSDIHLRQYQEFCATVADCFLPNTTVASNNSGSTSASTTSTDDLQYQYASDKTSHCAVGGCDAESGSGSLCYISGNSFQHETHFLQINQGHTSTTELDISHDYIIDEDQRDVSPDLIFPANLLDMNLQQHRYEEEAMEEERDRRQRCRSIGTMEDPFMSPGGVLTHSVQDPCKLYEFNGGSVHMEDPLLIFQDADCVTEPLDMAAANGGGGMGYMAGAGESPVYMDNNGNAAISPDGSASSGSHEKSDFWRYSSRFLSGGRDWLAGLQQTPPPPPQPPQSSSPFRPYSAAKSCNVVAFSQREDQMESPESLFLLDMAGNYLGEEEEEEGEQRRCISSSNGGEGQVMVQNLLMEVIRNMGEEEDGEEVLMKMEATLKRAMAEVGRKKEEMMMMKKCTKNSKKKMRRRRREEEVEEEGRLTPPPPPPPPENASFLPPSSPWLPPESNFCCF